MLACSYASVCSGCDWLLKPYDSQQLLKIAHLEKTWRNTTNAALPSVRFVPISESRLRDRVDLVFDHRGASPRLGLFDRLHGGVVDLQGCPMLSPALENWFQEFRAFKFPIQRGSIRLRVAPDGRKGVWLDFANIDVKNLLDERALLDRLRSVATIEIGQRRKRLIEHEGRLKLSDPVLDPWFETWIEKPMEEAIPLYCTIGTFTQPGFAANRGLVREVRELVKIAGAQTTFEFGAGIGNFTLPLASVCEKVQVFEIDALALQGLERSLDAAGLKDRVQIHRGDFQNRRREPIDFTQANLVLADPPRSGLRSFLDTLDTIPNADRPQHFIYVSCFAESFVADSIRLMNFGYQPESMTIVDQFPQSRHYEIVAHFERRC